MQPGRTPSWNVVADIEPTAWFEAVQPASDDRLPLPAALRKRVSWCAPTTSLPLLATIGRAGGVTVVPLGSALGDLAALQGALEGSDPANRAELAFAAMATYSQISLQPDGRLRLSPMLALHLGTTPGSRVWIGAYENTIRLWSDENWRSVLASTGGLLRNVVTATHA